MDVVGMVEVVEVEGAQLILAGPKDVDRLDCTFVTSLVDVTALPLIPTIYRSAQHTFRTTVDLEH